LISERAKYDLLAARKRGRTLGQPFLHADIVTVLQKLLGNGTSGTKAEQYLGIGRLEHAHAPFSSNETRSDGLPGDILHKNARAAIPNGIS